jgi:hypothetical protein
VFECEQFSQTAARENHLEEKSTLIEHRKSKDIGGRAWSWAFASHYPTLPSRNSCLLSHTMHTSWNISTKQVSSSSTSMFCICEVPGLNNDWDTDYLKEGLFVVYLSPSRIISGQYRRTGFVSKLSYICACKCDMFHIRWLLVVWLINYACLLNC